VEALALRQGGDGTGGGVSGTDTGDGFEVLADEVDVDLRPEGLEARLVEVDAGGEVALFEAEDDDARVDELLALNAGDDADDGVIK
jgi:hypothetical protein